MEQQNVKTSADDVAEISTDVQMDDAPPPPVLTSNAIINIDTPNEQTNSTETLIITKEQNDIETESPILEKEIMEVEKELEKDEQLPRENIKSNDNDVINIVVEEEEEDHNVNDSIIVTSNGENIVHDVTVTTNEDSNIVLDITENETLDIADIDSDSSDEFNDEEFENGLNEKEKFEVIYEGKAHVFIPASKEGVFYSQAQEFNRDLSIAVLNVFAKDHLLDPTVKKYQIKKQSRNSDTEESDDFGDDEDMDQMPIPGKKCRQGITVLDALSATGLRAMRYGLEVSGVNTIMANDMSQIAVRIIEKNVHFNNLNKIVTSRHFDAIDLMQLERIKGRHFDAIDLDPYGNPTRFLDSAVGSLRDGGLLLVTCTDMAVLCGNVPESCYVKYNSVSLKTAACHEMALRICLHLIETVCSKYGRFITPLLSFHADYYIRVFVKVFTSPQTCKATSTKTSMVFKCIGCNALSFQPLGMLYESPDGKNKFNISHGPVVNSRCVHCDGRHVMAGPIWTGPLHNTSFVNKVIKQSLDLKLATGKRIVGMLSVILEELKDIPLYYTLTNLCSVLHCEVIPMQEFRCALLNANYKVSLSHCAKNSFKTDAPMDVIWDILRCWIKDHPINEKRYEDPTVKALLTKEPKLNANFEFHEGSIAASTGLLRYQPNPQPFWGPGRKSAIGSTKPPKQNHNKHNRSCRTTTSINQNQDEESNTSCEMPSKKMKLTSNNSENSIELITLSDEEDDTDGNINRNEFGAINNIEIGVVGNSTIEDGDDSLDKEIFGLTNNGGDDGIATITGITNDNTNNEDSSLFQKIISNNNGKKVIKVTTDTKIIEEFNLCEDDDDDDELMIVNGTDNNKQTNNEVIKSLTTVQYSSSTSTITTSTIEGNNTATTDIIITTDLDDLENELNQEIADEEMRTKQYNEIKKTNSNNVMKEDTNDCGDDDDDDDVQVIVKDDIQKGRVLVHSLVENVQNEMNERLEINKLNESSIELNKEKESSIELNKEKELTIELNNKQKESTIIELNDDNKKTMKDNEKETIDEDLNNEIDTIISD